jgi:signal transduction histidine kinase
MESKDREFQKAIIRILILMVTGLIVWNLAVSVTNRRIAAIYYERISAIFGAISARYPDMEHGDWMQYLNATGNEEDGEAFLHQYGILQGDMPILQAQTTQKRFQITGNLVWILICTGILLIFICYQKQRNRKIQELVDYIRKIEHGIYRIEIEENEEGELSRLQNELYKITVMLRESSELAGQQKKALADSVSDISHQLKTPLTSCLVLLDNLAESENMTEETRRRFLSEITGQLTSVSWLVQVLLKLSRLDAGVVELKEEEVSVSALIREAVEKVGLLAEWKQIDIQVMGEEEPFIKGDRHWLEEALVNLIKNAIEHSPEDSEIRIQVEDNQVYTCIHVRDFGSGISYEDQKHIFERFYRSADAGEDSVGIGLALAQEIMKRQNGYLTVESEPGQGTVFYMKFLKCH